ncbi:murein biosynthesis integral membrane protein MurJ [uncultured Paenalcaligenes sp.]|uniref:murein biosynthesis integral membrane protein MurJ n=1 Tax=uncultured Paenalcaligenes sp. TaxID=1588925 RepID=UPI00263519A6|nr:lipid II flippase MurJ [uncultured Paenalcaligenes sp.]
MTSSWLKRLHSDHQRIARAAFRVAFFLLLGKAAGAFKEMAVAYRYGISDVVDAYQFTMVMANWIPVTMVGVFSVVLIPVLVHAKDDSKTKRQQFVGELLGLMLLLGLGVSAALWVIWPWVLSFAGKGLGTEAQAMSAELIWAFAPAAVLTLLTGLQAARLRAHERHINTLLDSVPAFSILLFVLAAGPEQGVWPLLWGTLIGYIVQSGSLYYLAQRADGFWGRPRFGFHAEQWPALAHAAGIMLIGQIAMSFVGPIDQYTAASLGDNANATLGYATRFISLMLGVGAASVGRAALPVLADVTRRGEAVRARSIALKWSLMMVAIGLAIAAVAAMLAPWGVSLLYERGAFSAADTERVSSVLRWGLLQLPFYFGVLVLVQLLASQNRYGLMAAIAIVNFAVKAIMNTYLASKMGVHGIMLATSCMYASSFICYFLVALKPAVLQAKTSDPE